MSINLCFVYVAIICVVVLMVYFQNKRSAMVPSYRMFYNALVALLIGSVLDIFCALYKIYPSFSGKNIAYVLNAADLMVQIFIATCFTVYALCVCSIDRKLSFHWMEAAYLPCTIEMILIVFFTIHTYNHGGKADEVARHPVLMFLLIMFMLYLTLLGIIICVRFHKTLGTRRSVHVLIAGIILMIVEILQIHKPDERFLYFICTLLMTDMLLAVQRPEEIFEGTEALKRRLLPISAEQDYKRNRHFVILFVKIFDYNVMLDSLGQEDAEQFIRQVCAYMNSLKRNVLTFQLEKDILAVKFPYRNKAEWNTLFEEVKERFSQPWRSGLLESMLSVGYVTADCPNEIPDMEMFHRLLGNVALAPIEAGETINALSFLGEDKEQQILTAIRRALDENRFQVFYQPIYSTHEKKVIAAEALIRLFDPEFGFIPPEPMIALAEREGYILQIGEIVFTEVCRFYSENHLDKLGIEYIEVNLSAVQCMQSRLAEQFMGIMRQFNLSSEHINFEITETSAMISNTEVSRNIAHFELHGVSLSLDDYGTGYSNISYLYNLPFLFMKVDKSILWSAGENEKADIILRNTFRMANRLHMKVVMEGVETEEQIRKLLELKCDYFQGYYFSKPVEGSKFIEYVKNFSLPEVCK